MIGLIDCNSFYASCERLFRPDLANAAMAVLSNNDGCVVALNKEAKEAGLKRGANYFEIEDYCKKNNIHIFSSNYALYQDISNRFISLLSEKVFDIMPYSIDEAFFIPGDMDMLRLKNDLEKCIGIPFSVGLARTKTLAKLANKIAKKSDNGVFILTEDLEEKILKKTAVEDVWGIGWSKQKKLSNYGIKTAFDYAQADDDFLKRNFTITGLRTAYELRGEEAVDDDRIVNATLCSGITFGEPKTEFEDLMQALTTHAHTLSEKLGSRKLIASSIGISIFTSRFRDDFYSPFIKIDLPTPSTYVPIFSDAIEKGLRIIYRRAKYKGCRLFAFDIKEENTKQYTLFDSEKDIEVNEKREKLAHAVNELRAKYGRDGITTARTLNLNKSKLTKIEMKSPHYSTSFSSLPIVKLD